MTPDADELWVFERWAAVFGKTGLTFDTKRAACLAERIIGGMTRADAEHALQGALADDYVMGRRDGIKHDRLTFIFGDQERFEEFRDRDKALRSAGHPGLAAGAARAARPAKWVDPDAQTNFVDRPEGIPEAI